MVVTFIAAARCIKTGKAGRIDGIGVLILLIQHLAFQCQGELLDSRYLYCLIKEIITANLVVSRMILTRKEQMEPVIVHVHTDLKSETARVILANSITLTPGTITVSMTEDDLLVHCLDKSLSEGMEDSVFVRLLKKMEDI